MEITGNIEVLTKILKWHVVFKDFFELGTSKIVVVVFYTYPLYYIYTKNSTGGMCIGTNYSCIGTYLCCLLPISGC